MIQSLVDFLLSNNIIAIIFYKILYMSIIGSFIGILILLIRKIFDAKISPKWKCILWGMFIIACLNPFRFEIKYNFEYKNKFINNLETIPQIAHIKQNEKNIQENGEILESDLSVSELISKPVDDEVGKEVIVQKQYSIKDIVRVIILPYIWLFVTLVFIATFVIQYMLFNKKIKNNKCDDIIVNTILRKCLKELKIKKNIKIYYQDYNKLTSIFGVFNSKILISKEVLNLDDESLKYIFMHELAHFKRKDLFFNLIMLLTVSVHFFNPIVWYIFKCIREDIELAADEYVVRKMNQNEKKQYGLTLIHMLELNQTNKYAINFLCMSDTERNMGRRIKMIKKPLKNKIFSIIFVIFIMIVAIVIIFIKSPKEENIILPADNITTLSQDYKHLWTEPKEFTSYEEYKAHIDEDKVFSEYITNNRTLTPEEKENLISKEEAIKIGEKILEKIGYTTEKIKSAEVEKYIFSYSKYAYVLRTTNGLKIQIDALSGEFFGFDYSNLIKEKFENEEISNEDLKKVCLNLYNTFDFLERGYEFYECQVSIQAQGVGDVNSPNYKQYTKRMYTATFYQKQDSGILNKYKRISIGFYIKDGKTLISGINCIDEIKSNQIYKTNREFIIEDNKLEISEDTAIKIAKEKDASISGSDKKIKKIETELINNMINYAVWAWEKGYTYNELNDSKILEDGTNLTYSKYYYDTNYVRNTYEVAIIYEIGENENPCGDTEKLGKVYYIDSTTGEILGGREASMWTDIEIENEYLFDKDDNYTVSKATYYSKKTGEKLWEYDYEFTDEMKAKFYIKKDEKPNPVSYNIY